MPSHATPKVHLYFDVPTAIFKARTNMPGTISYPLATLTYDTVTLGAYTAIEPDMTLTLGTTEGADDLGRVRVKALATSTLILLSLASQGVEDGTLSVADNAYITVYSDWRVWAKLPYLDIAGIDYKDGSIEVGDFNEEIIPVAVAGPHFADYINPATSLITVAFDGSLSYAMADGATIVSYAWNIGDGTLTVGSLTAATLTATFPAGKRWISLTVTDSNGKGHTTHRFVLAVNPAADVTVQTWQGTQRLTQQGQTLDVSIYDNLPRTTYPDGALVLLWWDAPSSPSDRSHMKFCGWHQSDSWAIRATKTGLTRDTVLHCVDVAGRLDTLPGFEQALERNEEVHWSHMPTLDINKCLHYLLHWHSTALVVADFFLPADGADYPSMRLDTAGATLQDQVNATAQKLTPDHILTCNSRGQLSVLADWQLMDVGDRPAAAPILTEDDYSELSVDYHRPPRVHVLRNSAVIASTDWLVIGGEQTLPLAFSIAPGDVFSQGTSEQTKAEGLTLSQAALNAATGHEYARLNARYGQARLKLPAPDAWDYEPALLGRNQLNIAAAYAAQRGLPFTQVNVQVKELSVRYPTDKTGAWVDPDLSVEFETSGLAAQTVTPVTPEPADPEVPEPDAPTVPPEMGLVEGVEQLAGIGIDGHVYRTSDFQSATPTYDDVDLGIGTVYSWVVDPFSPGYAPGATSGTVDGWEVTDTDIYRVADLFGTPVATSVFTFPTATVMASYHWRSIQASFGAYFAEGVNPWLLCVSYYGDTVGHTGTWATHSTDGGVTWSAEVQVSADYATDLSTRFNPIGVFTSPRTPGYALTAAHLPPAEESPIFWGSHVGHQGVLNDEESYAPLGFMYSLSTASSAAESAGAPDIEEDSVSITLHPPPDTKRLKIRVMWSANRDLEGGSSSNAITFVASDNGGGLAQSGSLSFVAPAQGTYVFGAAEVEWTYAAFASGDWPDNSADVIATPPPANNPAGCEVRAYTSANSSGSGFANATIQFSVRVLEMEDDAGLTTVFALGEAAGYASSDWGASWAQSALIDPGAAQAGHIHVPWFDNAGESLIYFGNADFDTVRQFRLWQSSGGALSDISPLSGGGAVRGQPFWLRCESLRF